MSFKVLSLFSGGGMGDLGLMSSGMEIVAQCEIDAYCQKILALRYPDSVKYKDIREVTGEKIQKEVGTIDLVAGGFPCQPFSTAGDKRGDQDDRHLWPEMRRVISEVRPAWVLGENVPGFINIALDDVLHDLEVLGYEATTFVFPAHACGAPHRRDRVWIVGYAKHYGVHGSKNSGSTEEGNKGEAGKVKTKQFKGSGQQHAHVANATNSGTKGMHRRKNSSDKITSNSGLLGSSRGKQQAAGVEQLCEDVANPIEYGGKWWMAGSSETKGWRAHPKTAGHGWWCAEPRMGRVAHGVSRRMDRLKLLGNGQVVHCTKFIGDLIMEFHGSNT